MLITEMCCETLQLRYNSRKNSSKSVVKNHTVRLSADVFFSDERLRAAGPEVVGQSSSLGLVGAVQGAVVLAPGSSGTSAILPPQYEKDDGEDDAECDASEQEAGVG